MKSFKFLTNEKHAIFHLNMMSSSGIFGRIPSRGIIIEQEDYTICYSIKTTVGHFFDYYPGRNIHIVGLLILDGPACVHVNYNNIDRWNQAGMIFRKETNIEIWYKEHINETL